MNTPGQVSRSCKSLTLDPARKARRDDSFVNNHQPPSGNGHQPWSMGEPGNGHGEPGHGMTHAPPSFTTSVSESIYPSDIESLSGTTTSSSVISTSTSSSTSTTTSSSAASAASGSAPSGSMPSGGGNSTGNSTGGAGQLASSISTFGEEVANTTHLSNLTVTPSTSGVEEIIFGNHSCILNPEGEVGPFCKCTSWRHVLELRANPDLFRRRHRR